MLMDFYEFTMSNGFFEEGFGDKIGYFDIFFRKNPDDGGFAVMAGVEQVIEYLSDLHFEKEDIEYLRSKGIFSEEYLKYLENFKFACDVWAIPEGTPIFPGEPIVTVRGPVVQAQLVETMLLLIINHQSLIATKANRIVRAAQGRPVMEFGSRRAQGADGAVLGARAAYIGGCVGTACALTDELYTVPALGTMAHSWVQMFDSEYEAFDTYCKIYPNSATLLIDTYNVIKSGLPNAIKAFKANGIEKCAVRIDSGDIAYLSRKVRKMLDEAGLPNCKIVVSNSLDEYIIRDLLNQGSQIDAFGVGERLITSKSAPVFGGVYKLCAVEDESGNIIPKIKISENTAKITNPHFKKVYRVFSKDTGKAEADLISVHDESFDEALPLTIFDPVYTWKRKTYENYELHELLVPIFVSGELVYNRPTTAEIRAYCADQLSKLWDEVKRFENPHNYYVDLSERLWSIKQDMLGGKGGSPKE